MIIGITGSFGSGKTTVAKIFEKLGAGVIDADLIGRSVLEEKKKDVVKAFGEEILKNQSIDRKMLADIVFEDKDRLKKLNKITHPLIIKRIKERLRNSKFSFIVIVAPLLIETELYELVDKIVLVVAEKDKLLKRMKKNGWELFDVERRMKNQPEDKERMPFSDIIIENNGSIRILERRVKKILKEELKFKIFEHTADIGITAFGSTKEEFFSNCAYGMFSILAELSNVRCLKRMRVSSSGITPDEMLVNTLSELLFCFTGKGFILRRFKTKIKGDNVSVEGWGEKLNPFHLLKMEIKTVTYHNLEIKKRNDGWIGRVIFDV
ncbi:MAG: dephospho-CoA kinase [Candidatus Desantisbacteria bacterium]